MMNATKTKTTTKKVRELKKLGTTDSKAKREHHGCRCCRCCRCRF